MTNKDVHPHLNKIIPIDDYSSGLNLRDI